MAQFFVDTLKAAPYLQLTLNFFDDGYNLIYFQMNTGSGKSLGFPLTVALQQRGKTIYITEPTIPAVKGLVKTAGEFLGESRVGYGASGYSNYTEATEIVYMTTMHAINNLVRFLQNPAANTLPDYLMPDEIHHPTSENYVIMKLIKFMLTLNLHIKVLVCSATLNVQALTKGSNATSKIISIQEERQFKLEIVYHEELGRPQYKEAIDAAAKIVQDELDKPVVGGDILIFMAGENCIDVIWNILTIDEAKTEVLPVCSSLPSQEMDIIFQPDKLGRRRVYISTNICESSVTLYEIGMVVDLGFHKLLISSATGASILDLQPIAQSNADQRAGRGGRTRNSVVHRMYSEHVYNQMSPHVPYEFETVQSAPLIYILKFLRANLPAREILDMDMLNYEASIKTLSNLGMVNVCVDGTSSVTPLGIEVINYPITITNGAAVVQAVTEFRKGMVNSPTVMALCVFMSVMESGNPSKLIWIPKEIRRNHHACIDYKDDKFSRFMGQDSLATTINLFNAMMQEVEMNRRGRGYYYKGWCIDNSVNDKIMFGVMSSLRQIVSHVYRCKHHQADDLVARLIISDAVDLDYIRSLMFKCFPERVLTSVRDGREYVAPDGISYSIDAKRTLSTMLLGGESSMPKCMLAMCLFQCRAKSGRIVTLASSFVKDVEVACE